MLWVGHVEQRVVKHRGVLLRRAGGLGFQEVLRRRLGAAQLGVIALVRLAENGEVHLLAGADMNHIRFRHLGLDGHGVQVCQLEEHGRQLAGDHGLAFLGDNAHHVAVDGRVDAGIGQVDLGGVDLDVRAFDLCVQGQQVGLLHLVGRFGVFEILA